MHTLIRTCTTLLITLVPILAAAQSGPPTRAATLSTPAETAAIEAGIKLHDAGKFDAAIAKYDEVLTLSPSNMTALYELAFSFAATKEYEKSLAAAVRGTEYESELLAMFYDLVGSAYDSLGQPDKAIDAYKKGIQIVPDPSMLYYNMGVTYLESLKNPDEARRALETAVTLDPGEAEFHLTLGQVFQSNGYSTPAWLAFSTYLVLDPAGPRALSAYGFWRAILRGDFQAGQTDPAAGAARPPKTDEGDFRSFETAIVQSQQTVITAMDRGASEMPPFLEHVNRMIQQLTERPIEVATFAGRFYLPFFAELRAKNYVEPFVYWSMQRAPVPGVREWINAHQSQVREFVTWSRNYPWAKP